MVPCSEAARTKAVLRGEFRMRQVSGRERGLGQDGRQRATRTRRADRYNSPYRRLHGARLHMDRPLSADQFQPHIGKDFKVKDGRHELTLRAVDLRRLEAWETALFERNPFTLIFSGPPRDVLP